MEDELTQKIMQRLAELPEDVRRAVQGSDMAKKIEALGVTHKLHIDQVGELENETLMVMLGFIKPEAFESQITNSLHLPAETAKQIATDINRDVFTAVRASLRRFTEEKALQKPTIPSSPAAMHPADIVLSEKTVTTVPPPPLKPQPYKTDPYREPTN